jgi:hypothetical protein
MVVGALFGPRSSCDEAGALAQRLFSASMLRRA